MMFDEAETSPSETVSSIASSLGNRVQLANVELAYDSFTTTPGHPFGYKNDPLLLVMGIGAQRIFWPDGLCEALVRVGFDVLRFDNRDVGESTKMDHLPTPSVLESMSALAAGKPVPAPYTLDHMADDTVALMDSLGLERAHVCGASMGGMIAQTVAIRHPRRIYSLVSIMSTTGNPDLPPADPSVMAALIAPAPFDAEGYADHAVQVWRTIGSPGFEFNEEAVRARARVAFGRGVSPKGFSRQLAAILAHGNRKPALAEVTTPTLVIHGDADRLVPPTGGLDTADAVPNAELLMFEGMGHDLPAELWDQMAQAVRATADRGRTA